MIDSLKKLIFNNDNMKKIFFCFMLIFINKTVTCFSNNNLFEDSSFYVTGILTLEKVECCDIVFEKNLRKSLIKQSNFSNHKYYVIDFYISQSYNSAMFLVIDEYKLNNNIDESLLYYYEVDNVVYFLSKNLPLDVFRPKYAMKTFLLTKDIFCRNIGTLFIPKYSKNLGFDIFIKNELSLL